MGRVKKIIVVGGNAAGPAAAAKAARSDRNAEVFLLERGPFISTGTCELPYLLSGEIKDHNHLVFFDDESFYRSKRVKVYTGYEVQFIDRKKKILRVKREDDPGIHSFDYDKLILTTGSIANEIFNLGFSPENLFHFKTVSDYLRINEYMAKWEGGKIIVLGAGYIGLETAAAFKEAGKNVTIIEKQSFPLPTSEPEISALIKDLLLKNGIEFVSAPEGIKPVVMDNKITALEVEGRFMETGMVISSAGFRPNTSLAAASGLKLSDLGTIKVNRKMQTSDPDIYAAGDNTAMINAVTGLEEYIPLATLAQKGGHVAGANATGDNVFMKPVVKNIAFKFFENFFASSGLTLDEALKHFYGAVSVSAVVPNLVKVMPGSGKVFGKIVFDRQTGRLLGASFFGGKEVAGYSDLVSYMILSKNRAEELSEIIYNYTPPLSPFINLLSVLGRKAKEITG